MNRIIGAAMITNGQTIVLEYLVLGAGIVVPVWLVMALLPGRDSSSGYKIL